MNLLKVLKRFFQNSEESERFKAEEAMDQSSKNRNHGDEKKPATTTAESGYEFRNGMIQIVSVEKALAFRGMNESTGSSKYTPKRLKQAKSCG